MNSFVKKREDYKPLLWVPKNIFLDIKIYEGFSLINSEILFKKNDLPYSQDLDLDNFIELNGVNLETINFSVLMDNDKSIDVDLKTLQKKKMKFYYCQFLMMHLQLK
jgi:hypothetical protein